MARFWVEPTSGSACLLPGPASHTPLSLAGMQGLFFVSLAPSGPPSTPTLVTSRRHRREARPPGPVPSHSTPSPKTTQPACSSAGCSPLFLFTYFLFLHFFISHFYFALFTSFALGAARRPAAVNSCTRTLQAQPTHHPRRRRALLLAPVPVGGVLPDQNSNSPPLFLSSPFSTHTLCTPPVIPVTVVT